MSLIQTNRFKLAIYAKGDINANKLAIIIPGRLDTKDYIAMTSVVDYLADRGYYALSFDPPGTWESPGDIELYTTTNIQKAINELIEYYGNKPTILVGHSRGGSHAMLAGTQNPHVTHFVAIMSHVGPSHVGTPKDGQDYVLSSRDLPPGTSRTTERKEFKLPLSYFEDQEKYDATDWLKTSPKHKLFFYGTQDDLVSEASVKEMYELSADSKMIHGVNTEHDYRLHPEAIKEVNEIIGEFLDKYEDKQ